MVLFHEKSSVVSWLQNHCEETIYFEPPSSQSMVETTCETQGGFEPMTHKLEIMYRKHYTIIPVRVNYTEPI